MVLPHLIADLPVFLLWGQDPTADLTVLPKLEGLADRLIFDSEAVDDLPRFASRLLAKASDGFVDMNWARLSPWRQTLAHPFNNALDIAQLREAETVEIVFTAAPPPVFSITIFKPCTSRVALRSTRLVSPSHPTRWRACQITYQTSESRTATVSISSREEASLPQEPSSRSASALEENMTIP